MLPAVVLRLLQTEFGATVKVIGVAEVASALPGAKGANTSQLAGALIVMSTVNGVPLEAEDAMETVCAAPDRSRFDRQRRGRTCLARRYHGALDEARVRHRRPDAADARVRGACRGIGQRHQADRASFRRPRALPARCLRRWSRLLWPRTRTVLIWSW